MIYYEVIWYVKRAPLKVVIPYPTINEYNNKIEEIPNIVYNTKTIFKSKENYEKCLKRIKELDSIYTLVSSKMYYYDNDGKKYIE